MVTHYATLATEPVDGVEIVWEVPYSWSRPRPATYLDPAEGGLELDGDPQVVKVTDDGVEILDEEYTEILVRLCGIPSEDQCWEAASDHNEARMEDPRY